MLFFCQAPPDVRLSICGTFVLEEEWLDIGQPNSIKKDREQ